MDGVPVTISTLRAPGVARLRAGLLQRRPATAAAPEGYMKQALSRRFHNITNVDVSASVAQIRGLDQVITVRFLFGFTLAARL